MGNENVPRYLTQSVLVNATKMTDKKPSRRGKYPAAEALLENRIEAM